MRGISITNRSTISVGEYFLLALNSLRPEAAQQPLHCAGLGERSSAVDWYTHRAALSLALIGKLYLTLHAHQVFWMSAPGQ